jgi:hypothetical protein
MRWIAAVMLGLSLPVMAGPVEDAIRIRLEPALHAKPLQIADTTMPEAVAEFYEQRQWRPAWDDARLQSLQVALSGLDADGLNPEDTFSLN